MLQPLLMSFAERKGLNMNAVFHQIPTAPAGMPVTDIIGYSAQFPGLVANNGKLRVHYQKFVNHHDTLEVGILGEGGLEKVETISGKGEALYPVGISFSDAEWYAWSETAGHGWAILVRSFRDGEWSRTLQVEEDEAVFYPNFFTYQGGLYLIWTRQHHHAAQAVMCRLDADGVGEKTVVSLSGEAYRANACEGGDGNLYVTYDAYVHEAYHVFSRVLTETGWSQEVQLDSSEEWTCQPRVIPSAGGATVCWYTFGYGAAFSVCSADLWVGEEGLCAAAPETITSNVGWYMDLAAASSKSGLQVLAYTWSKDAVQVRFRRPGEAWSQPAQMSYEDEHCAVHPSLIVEEDGQIILAWQFAYRNGHYDRNAQIVLTRFTPEDILKRADPSRESAENYFCRPIPAEKNLDKLPGETVSAWLEKNGYDCKLLFGDIHGQSNLSDGMGFIDQYYRRSRAKADLQFSCLTDHDSYPDWISQSEWELMRTTARLMDTDNELTCLLSFEWTPNEYQYDFGHKNVYFRDNEGDMFRSGEKSGITPTDLYASIKQYRAMCVPHHPAADWVMVSAATDWSFHDDQVERLVEIFSRHAPYEDFESQSAFTKNIKKMPRHSVQDALARGYRMGFTAGSDSHQMEHGVEGGIVAVFTPTHDRPGIWDSMYARKTYGTTGARILVSLKAGGQMMGSELKLAAGRPVHLEMSVLGTAAVRVDLVKNNQAVQTWESGGNAFDGTYTDHDRSAVDYYYLRVTQPDGHMAWSSPIWVELA